MKYLDIERLKYRVLRDRIAELEKRVKELEKKKNDK